MVEKITEDGALVFTFSLARNSEDLERVAELLGTSPYLTDAYTQTLQRDVFDRYEELLAALDDELERRQSQQQDQGEPQQPPEGQPRQPLIPRVAELLMLKRMEEASLRKVGNFLKTHTEIESGELGEIGRERLVRLGHQHTKITELFKKLVEEAEAQAQPPADDGDEEDDR